MTLDISKVKLLPWRSDRPAYWFKLADTKFGLYTPAPTEKQKEVLACDVIPSILVEKHEAALDDPNPYSALKNAISGATKKPQAEIFNELLAAKLTRTPSDFLREGHVLLKTGNQGRRDNNDHRGGARPLVAQAAARATTP